ncbi:hypothetical protein FOMPIDRAFT_1021044, partial [Fomitopsis schrenkii]
MGGQRKESAPPPPILPANEDNAETDATMAVPEDALDEAAAMLVGTGGSATGLRYIKTATPLGYTTQLHDGATPRSYMTELRREAGTLGMEQPGPMNKRKVSSRTVPDTSTTPKTHASVPKNVVGTTSAAAAYVGADVVYAWQGRRGSGELEGGSEEDVAGENGVDPRKAERARSEGERSTGKGVRNV